MYINHLILISVFLEELIVLRFFKTDKSYTMRHLWTSAVDVAHVYNHCNAFQMVCWRGDFVEGTVPFLSEISANIKGKNFGSIPFLLNKFREMENFPDGSISRWMDILFSAALAGVGGGSPRIRYPFLSDFRHKFILPVLSGPLMSLWVAVAFEDQISLIDTTIRKLLDLKKFQVWRVLFCRLRLFRFTKGTV